MGTPPPPKAPPPEMSIKGEANGRSTIVMEVYVCNDEFGRVWSFHKPQDTEDEQRSLKWSGGGARQIAYAPLTEAVRREAFASAMVEMSKGPSYLTDYVGADEEKRLEIEKNLGKVVAKVVADTAQKMGEGAAREILNMLVSRFNLSP